MPTNSVLYTLKILLLNYLYEENSYKSFCVCVGVFLLYILTSKETYPALIQLTYNLVHTLGVFMKSSHL